MGMLIDGSWVNDDKIIKDGKFHREQSKFAQPFLLNEEVASAAGQRCWLIASNSCPWSHGVTITRAFHSLQDQIGLHIAHGPRIQGYAINGGATWAVPGTTAQIAHLHQLYTLSDPRFSGRPTVPVFWDAQQATILSNESRRIMRALNSFGRDFGRHHFDLAPDSLAAEIDTVSNWLYDGLNNAVYRAGFAESQDAYDSAVTDVFTTLDILEERLSSRRYLLGTAITEADWRLFPTLVRFDAVYATLHRCQRRRLTDYPALWAYARDLYGWPGISETVDFAEIVRGSFLNDTANNPHRIVPVRPAADWTTPHGRDALGDRCIHVRTGEMIVANPATWREP
ncbi:MAG: glutathione S-transferase C-terminal domain-containing protein [Rhodospirillales bacterium]